MYIKKIQSQIGRFNMLSNDESLIFSIGIYDNKGIIERYGIKAILYIQSNDTSEKDYLENCFNNNIEEIFERAIKYSKSVISSVDYKEQCLLFYKLFKENFEEIKENYIKEKKYIIEKIIDSFKNDLKNIKFHHRINHMEFAIDEEIENLNRLVDIYEKDKLQLKEDSEKHKKCDEYIHKYKKEIEYLQSIK